MYPISLQHILVQKKLVLPRGPLADALPEESQLYSIYDLAFSNLYFGAV